MDVRFLINALSRAEKLKDATRHCYTSGGRHESVAEHSWRAALMMLLMKDEFPDVDTDRVLRMLLVHDLGEAFTGDIPTFEKTGADRAQEDALLDKWLDGFPEPNRTELRALFEEMNALQTPEAKLYKAIDSLEALLQHNESDLSTWLEREKRFNLVYADDRVAFSPYLTALREAIREDTVCKLGSEAPQDFNPSHNS